LHGVIGSRNFTMDEIYFRVARRINQLFPGNPMGEDLELIAQLIQEFASMIRFPYIQNITDMYVLVKNLFEKLVARSPALWDGPNKRRSMAYIIPIVYAFLTHNESGFLDSLRMIRKEHNLVTSQGKEFRPLYALLPLIENGELDRLYESIKRGIDMFKEITSLESRATRKQNGLPLVLSMSRDEFLRRFTVLPPTIIAGFAMSIHIRTRDYNMINSVKVNRLECIGGDPIVFALPEEKFWFNKNSIQPKLVPEQNLKSVWTSLRTSWDAHKEEYAVLETNLIGEDESILRDKFVLKRKSRSLSDDEYSD
jgi:hypothetical protein